MNFLLANSFTTFFETLFSNWQAVLFGTLTILLLLTIFFARFKLAFFILLSLSIGTGGVLAIDLIVEAIRADVYALIDFLIKWLPTILFSITVVLSTLIGFRRGRRKSLILLAHSAGAAILWFLLYYFLVKSTKIDAAILKLVNAFMGENGLQKAMGVSEEADTIRKILTLYFEKLSGEGTIGVLIRDNYAYVYPLADMAYHAGFAMMCYWYYLLTVFFLYVIYLCCYSERKYKRKKTRALGENVTDEGYKKRRVAGGFIGLARGIVAGILSLTFLGAGFYIAAGRGEGKLQDKEFGENYATPLKIYRSIESYGTQGIFLVLNALSDPDKMPYYLFAADLVFSGELNDEHNDISQNVGLTGELGSFTGLAREVVTLLMNHGSQEINDSLSGASDTGLMQSVLNVMKKEEFRREFDTLIKEYDSPTYIYNFAMSLVSSVLAHIDDMPFGESMNSKNKELLKILFKKGHLSPDIPDDCAMHDLNVRKGEEDPWLATIQQERPYLSLQQLVSKEDIGTFLEIFFTLLSNKAEGVGTFDTIRSLAPKIKELSLFADGRSQNVDPALARMYCYLQNAYLKEAGGSSYSYSAIVNENVSWVEEIRSLLDVAEDFFAVFDDVKEAESAVFNRILYIFDSWNPNREKDIALYDRIVEKITSSRILGKTLGSSFFRKTLTDGLGQLFETLYIPKNVVYENTYSKDGNIEKYGELYYFLMGLRHIGNMEDQAFFELLFGEENSDMNSILSTITDTMSSTDQKGNNLAYYVSNSNLLRSIVSCVLIESGDGIIYVPSTAKERGENGEYVNLIVSGDLEIFLNKAGYIFDFVTECIDGDYYANIDKRFDDEEFMGLLDTCRILEASLSDLVKDKIASGGADASTLGLIVPKALSDDTEKWCTSKSGESGELKRFISSYRTLRDKAGKDATTGEFELSLKNLMNGDKTERLLSIVSNFGEGLPDEECEAEVNEFLSSEIIYYTISNGLLSEKLNNLTVIVPASARVKLYQDAIESVIKREELSLVFSRITRIGLKDGMDETDLLKTLIKNKDAIAGEIMCASAIANMTKNEAFNTALKLKETSVADGSDVTYYVVGSERYLEEGYYDLNPWSKEFPLLLTVFHSVFNEKIQSESFTFDQESLVKAIYDAKDDLEAVEACRNSRIIFVGYGRVLEGGASTSSKEAESTT